MTPDDMTILLVDDEPDIVDATSVAFELSDFNVITANSGREAWDILNKKTVDIVITDVRMPDGSGLELLDNIKSKNLYFPEVILTTGYADFSVEEIFEKGADGLFWKPFDTKKIIAEVENRLLNEEVHLGVAPKGPIVQSLHCDFSSMAEPHENKHFKLGRGGFFLNVEKDFPEIGQLVDFKIAVSEGLPVQNIEGIGEVRWVRIEKGELPVGIGIEFKYLDSACREPLLAFLKDQKFRAYIPR